MLGIVQVIGCNQTTSVHSGLLRLYSSTADAISLLLLLALQLPLTVLLDLLLSNRLL